jgi:hypothetical protein
MTGDPLINAVYETAEVTFGEDADDALALLGTITEALSPDEATVILSEFVEDPHRMLGAINDTLTQPEYADLDPRVAAVVEHVEIQDELEAFNAAVDDIEQRLQASGVTFDRQAFYGILEAQGDGLDLEGATSDYLEMVSQAQDNELLSRQVEAANLEEDRQLAVADRADKLTENSPARDGLDAATVELQAEQQLRAEANAEPRNGNDPLTGGDLGAALDEFLAVEPVVRQAHDQMLKAVDPRGEMNKAQRQQQLDQLMHRATPASLLNKT